MTFPGTPWDGESHMQIPWTEGVDHEAGEDFISHKELLVAQFGDPAAREKLIAAISK